MLWQKQKIYTLTASSPSELKEKLDSADCEVIPQYAYLRLLLSDPQFVVRPFHIQGRSVKKVRQSVSHEIVELLGLPLHDVQMDYQVFHSDSSGVWGLYCCLQRKRFLEYLRVVDDVCLTPVQVSSVHFEKINTIFRHKKESSERICLIDIIHNARAAIVIFQGGKCELFRELGYREDWSYLEKEVVQSLRSVCAKSEKKEVNNIFISGMQEPREAFFKGLAKTFAVEVIDVPEIDQTQGMSTEAIVLNIARETSCSLQTRQKIFQMTNGLILLLGFCAIVLVAKCLWNQHAVEKLKDRYPLSRFEYAQGLQKRLKELHDGK